MIVFLGADGTVLARTRRVDCDWLDRQGGLLVLLSGPTDSTLTPRSMRGRAVSSRVRRLVRNLHGALRP